MALRWIAVFVAVFLLALTKVSVAHPLGNFSISQYSALRISRSEIEIRYGVDLAEIPTFQEIQQSGLVPAMSDAGTADYLRDKVEALREDLSLEINGEKIALITQSREILFPEGAGGLPTMKIGAVFKGRFDVSKRAPYELLYRDRNFPGRAGWKEIIGGIEKGAELLETSVPGTDRSAQLSNYPTDLLNSPPQVLEARMSFMTTGVVAAIKNELVAAPPIRKAVKENKSNDIEPMAPNSSADTQQEIRQPSNAAAEPLAVPLQPNKQAKPNNAFTELISPKELNWSMMLFALAVAAALGAFHALEPGHGKSLVAAYLVGSQGTVKHAMLLGLVVTASHTAAVYVLGGIVLYASQYVVPEKLYPWLALASGVITVGLGVMLLMRRLRANEAALYHHHHDHHDLMSHDHFYDSDLNRVHADHHPHGDPHHHHNIRRTVSLRELLTLGISGGMVPCPAALVVLLSAVSLHRIGFGLMLIVAFSVGLAAVLIAIGLVMVYAGRLMSRFHGRGQMINRWLPLTSSAFIVLFGLGLTWQALASAGLIRL